MLADIPISVSIIFFLTVLLTVILFCNAFKSNAHNSFGKLSALVLSVWLFIQSGFSYLGVYYNSTDVLPPRIFVFGIFPTIIGMIILFNTAIGRKYIDQLSVNKLTLISLVRIPVEIVLWLLFLTKTIPDIMTFEGWNFDILAGISAPFIAYAWVKLKKRNLLFIWNALGLLLLTWIVVISTLASPFPLQQLAFDQPNIAILYFPFSLLPTVVVPIVYFSHLASLRLLLKTQQD